MTIFGPTCKARPITPVEPSSSAGGGSRPQLLGAARSASERRRCRGRVFIPPGGASKEGVPVGSLAPTAHFRALVAPRARTLRSEIEGGISDFRKRPVGAVAV